MSPSFTLIFSMMPPSRCWMVLRLVITATCPLATTPLASGAVAAHVPKTPKASASVA